MGRAITRGPDWVEDVEIALIDGNAESAAERLGMSYSAIEMALRRAGRPDLARPFNAANRSLRSAREKSRRPTEARIIDWDAIREVGGCPDYREWDRHNLEVSRREAEQIIAAAQYRVDKIDAEIDRRRSFWGNKGRKVDTVDGDGSMDIE